MTACPIGAEARELLEPLRSWEELAILLAVAIPDDRETPVSVARALAVSEDSVRSAIARLGELGLLVRGAPLEHLVPTAEAQSSIRALAAAYGSDPAGVLRVASALAMERARMSASVLMALEALAGRR